MECFTVAKGIKYDATGQKCHNHWVCFTQHGVPNISWEPAIPFQISKFQISLLVYGQCFTVDQLYKNQKLMKQ